MHWAQGVHLCNFAKFRRGPTLKRNMSPIFIGGTFTVEDIPTAESKRLVSNDALIMLSGSVPGLPTTEPINESPPVKDGSNFVPMATSPPGRMLSTKPAPVPSESIVVVIELYVFFLPVCTPGFISISSPTLKTPAVSEPPITPPFIFGMFVPGLFTSKERSRALLD